MTERWCPRCKQHLVDPRHGVVCPACLDQERLEDEAARRELGWR